MQKWPGISPTVTTRREIAGSELIPAEDQETILFHTTPAHHETIAAHLMRLAVHRHIKGDDAQKGYLIADYTKRLMQEKITELDLFFAVEYFIENDENDFFPAYAKLRKQVVKD